MPLLALCLLSACGGGGGGRLSSSGGGGYTPPGPPEDPWGPYIVAASGRYSVPESWIRGVMHQESGGREYLHGQPITSDAGAAGLMQIMPATYAELRDRYGLGNDPYDPHDNIFAGTAYIKELYNRFGSPAFLAAYNAGPQRVDDYMAGRGILPNETVNYLASVAPRLSRDLPMSGPLAAYADSGGAGLQPDPVPQAYASAPIARCWRDPDAAYDPNAPCRAPPQAPIAEAPQARLAEAPPPPAVRVVRNCWHDPNAAYDPDAPCVAPPVHIADVPPPSVQTTTTGSLLWNGGNAQIASAPPLSHPGLSSYLIPSAAASEPPPLRASGAWAIQVGAFADAGQARRVAENARGVAQAELGGTHIILGATTPFGGQVLYRARLLGLSAQTAASACALLAAQRQACVTVPPGG